MTIHELQDAFGVLLIAYLLKHPEEREEVSQAMKTVDKMIAWGKETDEAADEPTLTIFRKYPDDTIVALFPEVEGAHGMCTCYVHVGQHGSAHYHHVIQTTMRATPEEYADLATELTSIGYVLKVRQKWIRRRR